LAFNIVFAKASYKLNNYQEALYNYNRFTYGDVDANFVRGTFGYEEYNDQSNPRNSMIQMLIFMYHR